MPSSLTAQADALIATLAQSDIKTIAIVSCNPVTFARDAQTLIDAGFAMAWVQVVDRSAGPCRSRSIHTEVTGGRDVRDKTNQRCNQVKAAKTASIGRIDDFTTHNGDGSALGLAGFHQLAGHRGK